MLHEYLNMSKLFTDLVYKEGIVVSEHAQKLINTHEFQRLRHIKQLGCCHYVYPSASTSRFEHSIGVYHMTGLMLQVIKSKNPDLLFDIPHYGKTVLTDELIEYIMIAGLLHDIGHGPFSHLFDNIIKQKYPDLEHEERSIIIIREITKRELNLDDDVINLICNLIEPPEDCKDHPLFQIVSNSVAGLDSDKLDYLVRDSLQVGEEVPFQISRIINSIDIIDGKLVYPESAVRDVLKVFITRHYMYKYVYNHPTVKTVEIMMSDILMLLNPILGITDSVIDMKKFCSFVDDDVYSIFRKMMVDVHCNRDKNFQLAFDIYDRLIRRDLYCVVYSGNRTDIFDKLSPELQAKITYLTIDVGFVNCKKPNPFDKIYFYSPLYRKPYTLKPSDINSLITDNYYEKIVYLIVKETEYVSVIESSIHNILYN
jgi:HD superfamily phosphohydrolase